MTRVVRHTSVLCCSTPSNSTYPTVVTNLLVQQIGISEKQYETLGRAGNGGVLRSPPLSQVSIQACDIQVHLTIYL